MSDVNHTSNTSLNILLEENLLLHSIGAEIFTSFVIDRFGGGSNSGFADLSISKTDDIGHEQKSVVHLTWLARSSTFKPLPVQEHVLTEWGALGVACALIPKLLGLRVLSVALEGERFDYRIGNDTEEWSLEVSGTLSENIDDLRERQRLKIRQLRENPARLRGYVIVVGFTLREILISFHLPYMD